MNESTPYEQLIAAKLDQVPVPDMADSIWSTIEMQLDAPATTSKSPGWYGLAGVVVVLVLLLWYLSHKNHALKDTMPPGALPENPMTLPVQPPPVEDSHVSDRSDKKKDIPVMPAGGKKDTVAYHGVSKGSILSKDSIVSKDSIAAKDSILVDSAAKEVLPSIKTDSSSLQRHRPALPDVDLYEPPQSLTPRDKKHKGVKGITDDDYKISASKDSGKKMH